MLPTRRDVLRYIIGGAAAVTVPSVAIAATPAPHAPRILPADFTAMDLAELLREAIWFHRPDASVTIEHEPDDDVLATVSCDLHDMSVLIHAGEKPGALTMCVVARNPMDPRGLSTALYGLARACCVEVTQ